MPMISDLSGSAAPYPVRKDWASAMQRPSQTAVYVCDPLQGSAQSTRHFL